IERTRGSGLFAGEVDLAIKADLGATQETRAETPKRTTEWGGVCTVHDSLERKVAREDRAVGRRKRELRHERPGVVPAAWNRLRGRRLRKLVIHKQLHISGCVHKSSKAIRDAHHAVLVRSASRAVDDFAGGEQGRG